MMTAQGRLIPKLVLLLLLGAVLAGCDKCGDWISPMQGEVCRNQRPQ